MKRKWACRKTDNTINISPFKEGEVGHRVVLNVAVSGIIF